MWNWLRGEPLVRRLREDRQDWFFLHDLAGGRLQIIQINGESSRRVPYVLAAADDRVVFFPLRKHMAPFAFAPDDIHWFGRPHKYTPGMNTMWVHVERKEGWYLVKFSMDKSRMVRWVRVIKHLTPDDLETAYRRHRPYIHDGPVEAAPAEQDIYGVWTLHPPLSLYLTPLDLVLLNGLRVVRIIPLNTIQNIRYGARLDAPDLNGLVRFTTLNESVAFALPAYERFAANLAEAAKRSLETPIQRKQKPKEA